MDEGEPSAGGGRREHQFPWMLVAALAALGVLAYSSTLLRPPTLEGLQLPRLASSLGPQGSCLDLIRVRQYALALTPPGTDSYPYEAYIDGTSADPVSHAQHSILDDQNEPAPARELDLAARQFVFLRDTTVEIETFAHPHRGPGTLPSYQRARWIEQGRAAAAIYTWETRPVSELVAMIQSLHPVSQADFETQLCDHGKPRQPPVPHLVGPDAFIVLFSTGFLSEDIPTIGSISIRTPTPEQGTADDMVATQARSEPGSAAVTIRGHPGWKVPFQGQCGALIWAEAGAQIEVQSCFGDTEIKALDALYIASDPEWRHMVFGDLDR